MLIFGPVMDKFHSRPRVTGFKEVGALLHRHALSKATGLEQNVMV
jgi:hypothetical protein